MLLIDLAIFAMVIARAVALLREVKGGLFITAMLFKRP